MCELYYIVNLSTGNVTQTSDKNIALAFSKTDGYIVINESTGEVTKGDSTSEITSI